MTAAEFRSGKGAGGENFPVASWLIRRRHRPLIRAFYEFVRTADDVADHETLAAEVKLAQLHSLERSLCGEAVDEPEGVRLAAELAGRGLDGQHARDLLAAFRQDVVKGRYADWDDLLGYCRLSAMPVGRFVLDVHGESRALWPQADALCAALQIINHLQDCGADYRRLDRVYLPQDLLARHGVELENLRGARAAPPLLACIRDIVARTEPLVAQSARLAAEVADPWLAMEIAAIHGLADRLLGLLKFRDPLSEPVHLNKAEALLRMAGSGMRTLPQRRWRGARTGTARLSAPVAHPAPSGAAAGGSSFYLAMRILGREQREAMFQVYAFCRAVDDIADGDAPGPQRLAQLEDWRARIDALFDGGVPPGLEPLARVILRFALRRQDFHAVIDGMAMDAAGDIRAPGLGELELYCDRVACAVGRLSVRIFGLDGATGDALAYHLGSALQFTNILRDLDEDAALGRLYLPREALLAAGIGTSDPQDVAASDQLDAACLFLAERAFVHFARADAIMRRCPRHKVRAPRIMGEVYRRMLNRMVQRGWRQPRQRVRLNNARLVWIALRHAFA